jgi:sirohydrochlorin ferrochelatase
MSGADRPPALLAVGHGTRDPAGIASIRALLDRVRALRPGLAVVESYAEITAPALEDAVARLGGPAVAVPLMLGRGYHAQVDVPGRIGVRAVVARPLGPHALLTRALADRLREAGSAPPGAARPAGGRPAESASCSASCSTGPVDAVVLGAAGTSDPAGAADARLAAGLLGRRLARPVAWGFAATAEPSLPDVVRALRRRGARRVAVASYLLAPGFFHRRLLDAGADLVSAPLGPHDALARLVLHRYDEAAAGAREVPGNADIRA